MLQIVLLLAFVIPAILFLLTQQKNITGNQAGEQGNDTRTGLAATHSNIRPDMAIFCSYPDCKIN